MLGGDVLLLGRKQNTDVGVCGWKVCNMIFAHPKGKYNQLWLLV